MQALLRATASIADAAKRGSLDKVWISLEGVTGSPWSFESFCSIRQHMFMLIPAEGQSFDTGTGIKIY